MGYRLRRKDWPLLTPNPSKREVPSPARTAHAVTAGLGSRDGSCCGIQPGLAVISLCETGEAKRPW
ncbi:MAG: hypothetical protein OJF48_003647 [Afipia sp.]|nr:MAG: hypothetical protein OJF48_003647 [Afipia sp.]